MALRQPLPSYTLQKLLCPFLLNGFWRCHYKVKERHFLPLRATQELAPSPLPTCRSTWLHLATMSSFQCCWTKTANFNHDHDSWQHPLKIHILILFHSSFETFTYVSNLELYCSHLLQYYIYLLTMMVLIYNCMFNLVPSDYFSVLFILFFTWTHIHIFSLTVS